MSLIPIRITRVSLILLSVLFVSSIFQVVESGSNDASKEWLENNSKKDGVITLPSGLQYKVLKSGTGVNHPAIDTECVCHYKGTLIDGTQFDSSYDRGEPTTFAPNQVIKGWTEAMQLMVEGDKWELYIPSELGYGDSGSPPKIQGGDALVFVMEILKIKFICDPITFNGCTDDDKSYIKKINIYFNNDVDEMDVELERLQGLINKLKTRGSKEQESLQTRFDIISKLRDHADNDEL